MIYTPQKHPTQAFTLITIMVLVGVIGGNFFHYGFIVISLIFWMQYTLVLAILQIIHKSKHPAKSFTGVLLNPYFRFLLFEILGLIGIISVLVYNSLPIGTLVLGIWWLFSINFYIFYRTMGFREEEED